MCRNYFVVSSFVGEGAVFHVTGRMLRTRFLFPSTQVKNLLDVHVLAFIPAILLGMLGGLLGALFVSLNIKINKLRMQFFNSIPKSSLSKTSKLLETLLILVSK